jgi:hypothetical protein
MATGKRVYGIQTWIEGDASPTWTTLSGTTEEYSQTIDNTSNGYDVLHLFPEVDFDNSPTDNVWFSVYGSPDGTNWNDVADYKFLIDKGTDPCQVGFAIPDPPPYTRVGFKQSGSTDSHNVRCSYVGSRWDVS